MGFSKAILAPRKGVVATRLKMQNDLLYDDLDAGLKLALRYDPKK